VALIDYENVVSASHAKDHLNNIVFFESAIKVKKIALQWIINI